MFILKKEATFTYPIVYFQPADGGTQIKQSFDAIFKILPQSRINELSLLVEKKKKEIDEGILDGIDINDEKVADEILVGWEGIELDGGKPFTNTVENKKMLLDQVGLSLLLVEKYFEEVAKQKEKN